MKEKKKDMERQRYLEEGTNYLRHIVTQFKKRTGTNSVNDKQLDEEIGQERKDCIIDSLAQISNKM